MKIAQTASQKPLGQQRRHTTQPKMGKMQQSSTGSDGKRYYAPRSRKCAFCDVEYTPKRRGVSRFCSQSCRQKDYHRRKRRSRKRAVKPIDLTPKLCKFCNCGYWGSSVKRNQAYCDTTCRNNAWKARRAAAEAALEQHFTLSSAGAVDLMERRGLATITRLLNGAGYHYMPQMRRFVEGKELEKT